MNRPATVEGVQVWDLVGRLQGQLRIGGVGSVIGLDMNAAFTLAEALGVDRRAVAELLPAVEAGLVRGCRKDEPGLDED